MKFEMLKDWLMYHTNCSGRYTAIEYWVNKYWDTDEELKKLKALGRCDHEIRDKL